MEVLNKLKGRKDAMPAVLVAASAIIVVLVLFKVAGFFKTSTWAMGLASEVALVGESGDSDAFKKSKEAADALKKKNLFAPPAAKQHPVKAVPGILGSSAFINGKWFGEGQNIGDESVLTELARESGVPDEVLERAWTDKRYEERLQQYLAAAHELDVRATPTIFFGEKQRIDGALPLSTFRKLAQAGAAAQGGL